MDRRVAKRYATALFRTAQKANVVDAVEDDLNAIQGVLDHDARFAGFLYTPRISREHKAEIIDRLFSDRITALTAQLLRLLLHKRRETEFPRLREEFISLRREFGGVLYVQVTSAQPLDDAQKGGIVAKLAEKSGKRVEADFHVDPHLIGGVKVGFGNYVLDGTVRGSLNRLRDNLKYDLLKQS